MAKVVGYARVSTQGQDLALQCDDLEQAGCTVVFQDVASGAKTDRPQLEACLEHLEAGDTLVVWRLDRLGRSMRHLVDVVESLRTRGVAFRSLRDGMVDTTTPSGELVFHIFAAMAQFERSLIQERVQAGLKAARARGRKGGRKSITGDDSRVKAVKAMYQGGAQVEDICASMGVGKTTVYRWLKL